MHKTTYIPGIYTITNLISGRVYVGRSVKMGQRWSKHRHRLKTGVHGNPYLQSAWDKYGPDAFEFAVWKDLSGTPEADLAARLHEAEAEALAAFPRNYNLAQVLPGGVRLASRTRALIVAEWAKPQSYARKVAALRAASATPEVKANRSKGLKKRWADPGQLAKQRQLVEQIAASSEIRAAKSKITAAYWADPANRAARRAALQKAAADPALKAKRLAQLRAGLAKKAAAKAAQTSTVAPDLFKSEVEPND